jgi:hypothetical protein
MSRHALRKGHHVRIGASEFVILQRISERAWQLQNVATGEWCAFTDDDLLERFARSELSFVGMFEGPCLSADHASSRLTRSLSTYPTELQAIWLC